MTKILYFFYARKFNEIEGLIEKHNKHKKLDCPPFNPFFYLN
jgi:hypothetical protein